MYVHNNQNRPMARTNRNGRRVLFQFETCRKYSASMSSKCQFYTRCCIFILFGCVLIAELVVWIQGWHSWVPEGSTCPIVVFRKNASSTPSSFVTTFTQVANEKWHFTYEDDSTAVLIRELCPSLQSDVEVHSRHGPTTLVSKSCISSRSRSLIYGCHGTVLYAYEPIGVSENLTSMHLMNANANASVNENDVTSYGIWWNTDDNGDGGTRVGTVKLLLLSMDTKKINFYDAVDNLIAEASRLPSVVQQKTWWINVPGPNEVDWRLILHFIGYVAFSIEETQLDVCNSFFYSAALVCLCSSVSGALCCCVFRRRSARGALCCSAAKNPQMERECTRDVGGSPSIRRRCECTICEPCCCRHTRRKSNKKLLVDQDPILRLYINPIEEDAYL